MQSGIRIIISNSDFEMGSNDEEEKDMLIRDRIFERIDELILFRTEQLQILRL